MDDLPLSNFLTYLGCVVSALFGDFVESHECLVWVLCLPEAGIVCCEVSHQNPGVVSIYMVDEVDHW